MSKYTAEEVHRQAEKEIRSGKYSITWDMLRDYAATLSQQAEWPSDAEVERALVEFHDWNGMLDDEREDAQHRVAMRAALQSVRQPASDNESLLTGTTDGGLPYGLRGTAESVNAFSDYLARLEAEPDVGVVSDEDVRLARLILAGWKGTMDPALDIPSPEEMREVLQDFASRHARQVPDPTVLYTHQEVAEVQETLRRYNKTLMGEVIDQMVDVLLEAAPPAPEKD